MSIVELLLENQTFVSITGLVAGALGFMMSAVGACRSGLGLPPGRLRLVMASLFLVSAAMPVASGAEAAGREFPWVLFIQMAGLGVVFSLAAGRAVKSRVENHVGFRWVLSGFWMMFIGVMVKLSIVAGLVTFAGSDGIIGVICGLGGVVCLGVGIHLWLPSILELDRARADLERQKEFLEEEVARRTAELRQEVAHRREAELAARESNLAKSKFLANMSHELRTPLNAVIGFSDLLAMPGLELGSAKIKEYAADINGAGRHLLDIVNDVLDLAKVEAGRMEVALETIELGRVIEAAVRIAQGKAVENGVEVTASRLDGIAIVADSRAVRQILINLLSNAVKFTPRGGLVRVSGSLVDGCIELRVADNGCGIPADKIEAVFEPFEQVENAYARSQGGTGLGLALCRKLAELMNGTMRLESELGVGTSAIVTLPLAAREAITPAA